jgi:hypothetical protein
MGRGIKGTRKMGCLKGKECLHLVVGMGMGEFLVVVERILKGWHWIQ